MQVNKGEKQYTFFKYIKLPKTLVSYNISVFPLNDDKNVQQLEFLPVFMLCAIGKNRARATFLKFSIIQLHIKQADSDTCWGQTKQEAVIYVLSSDWSDHF